MNDLIANLRAVAASAASDAPWCQLVLQAADEIERLQSLVGAASTGPSLADLKRDLPTAPKDANG